MSSIVIRGFFTSQRWVRGKNLSQLEQLIGYRAGRLAFHGAEVYALTRVPDNWEFDVKGYTNSSGGMKTDPNWEKAEKMASAYYAKTGVRSSETVLRDNARATMTVTGSDRLIKIKPLLDDPNDTYPPGAGIPQWRVSDLAAQRGTVHGSLLFVIRPGALYPI